MSILEKLKSVFASDTAQTIVSEIPDVVQAGVEIAANPSIPNAVSVLAELVQHELSVFDQKIEQAHQAVAQMGVPSPATVTPEQIAQIVEKVIEAINPKLAQYAPLLDLVAQHFPHLKPAE